MKMGSVATKYKLLRSYTGMDVSLPRSSRCLTPMLLEACDPRSLYSLALIDCRSVIDFLSHAYHVWLRGRAIKADGEFSTYPSNACGYFVVSQGPSRLTAMKHCSTNAMHSRFVFYTVLLFFAGFLLSALV